MEPKPEPKPEQKPIKQAWHLGVTPAQRLQLVEMLATTRVPLVQGLGQGKVLTRFRSAFGLDAIREAALRGSGEVDARLATSSEAKTHLVTIENAEFFMAVVEKVAMTPRQHMLLEPLIDLVERALKGEDVTATGPHYDPELESWVPRIPSTTGG